MEFTKPGTAINILQKIKNLELDLADLENEMAKENLFFNEFLEENIIPDMEIKLENLRKNIFHKSEALIPEFSKLIKTFKLNLY